MSENVDQYLGLSMVSRFGHLLFSVVDVGLSGFVSNQRFSFFQIDVLQGDTFYDMVERSDIDVVKTHLEIEHNSPSGNFIVAF